MLQSDLMGDEARGAEEFTREASYISFYPEWAMLTATQFEELKALEGERAELRLTTGERFICTIFLCTRDSHGLQQVIYEKPENVVDRGEPFGENFQISGDEIAGFREGVLADWEADRGRAHQLDIDKNLAATRVWPLVSRALFLVFCGIYVPVLVLCGISALISPRNSVLFVGALGIGFLVWKKRPRSVTF